MRQTIIDCLFQLFSLAALVLLGLMAGFFFAFSVDVAPAMTHLDAAAYITAQQWINRVVRNAVFGAAYFGAAILPFCVALSAMLAGRKQTATTWGLIAVLYFSLVFWLTRSVNIPINNVLALWNPGAPPPEWMQLRDSWNQANSLRAWAAFACFSLALLELHLRNFNRPAAA